MKIRKFLCTLTLGVSCLIGLHHIEAAATFGQGEFIPNSKSEQAPPPEVVPAMKGAHELYLKNRATLLTMGDSITYGWINHGETCYPYGYYAAQEANLNYLNASYPSNQFVKKNDKFENYFGNLIEHSVDKIKKANVITIMEGTNDYGRNSSLDEVQRVMEKDIERIKEINPKAQIIGILPMNRFDKSILGQSAIGIKNRAGYTLGMLRNMEKKVYQSFDIPVTSFEAMGLHERPEYYVDRLHPDLLLHQEMGRVLAKYLMSPKNEEDNQLVEVIHSGKRYSSLSLNTVLGEAVKGQVYVVRRRYYYYDGNEYLSIYDLAGHYQGLILSSLVKENMITKELKKQQNFVFNFESPFGIELKLLHPET